MLQKIHKNSSRIKKRIYSMYPYGARKSREYQKKRIFMTDSVFLMRSGNMTAEAGSMNSWHSVCSKLKAGGNA